MKLALRNFLLLFFLLSAGITMAQERYLDEIFDEVSVTKNVVYGRNYSILPTITGESDTPRVENLLMDIYEPASDTLSERPVVIVIHAGDYLPAVLNQSPYGKKEDSAFVAFCMKFAKRGFVAASITYRTGWNPFNPEEIERRKQVFEASVRGTQDMRTCVRYFRKTAREDGNPFRIDSTKFAMGSEDAPCYSVMNVAFLDSLEQAFIPKFLDFSQTPAKPFVDSLILGDVYGIKPARYNIPNHLGYSSDINMAFALVGGLAEFSWIQPGDIPIVGIQNITTFDDRGIRDETIGDIIILADAAYTDTVVARSVELGNNDVFKNANLNDPITQIAMERSGGLPGMLVLNTPRRFGRKLCDPTAGADSVSFIPNGDPWNWFDENLFKTLWNFTPYATNEPANVKVCNYTNGNPNDPELAKTYIDTIVSYLAPRLVLAMGIEGTSITTSLGETLARQLSIQVYPNPVSNVLYIKADAPFESIRLYDLQGKTVYFHKHIQKKQFQIERNDILKGVYLLEMSFKQGKVVEKILWN